MERKINKKSVHHDKKLDSSKLDEDGINKPKNINNNFSNELRVVIKVKSKENNVANQKNNQLAMGDSKKKKTDKPKNTAIINVKRTAQRINDRKFADDKSVDLTLRKKLRDRYTFRLQNPDNNDSLNAADEVYRKATKQERLDMQRNDKISRIDSKNINKDDKEDINNKEREKPVESSEDSGILVEAVTVKKERQRKPIIKTITSKNDTSKIYKAVTFVDNEQKKKSTLEISIPNDAFKRFRTSKCSPNKTKSPTNPRKATHRVNTDKKKENSALSSPELSIAGSPTQTEVAKWVPASIDQLTKPYYDAWVDTTVAAVFREEMDDTQKQLILDSIKKSIRDKELQRTNSLDLTYENWKDESYTGRIKIRHREKHKKANVAVA